MYQLGIGGIKIKNKKIKKNKKKRSDTVTSSFTKTSVFTVRTSLGKTVCSRLSSKFRISTCGHPLKKCFESKYVFESMLFYFTMKFVCKYSLITKTRKKRTWPTSSHPDLTRARI